MTKELTCIGCPMGCRISVVMENGDIVSVSGNSCKNGEKYARKEVTAPTRIVTGTVRVLSGDEHMVSCKTECDVPKDSVLAVAASLRGVTVKAPVKIGDILLPDVAGTGVNMIATKNVNLI